MIVVIAIIVVIVVILVIVVLIATIVVIAVISYLEGNNDDPKGINITKKLFSTDSTFNIAAFGVLLITAFLYAMFW